MRRHSQHTDGVEELSRVLVGKVFIQNAVRTEVLFLLARQLLNEDAVYLCNIIICGTDDGP